MRPIYSLLKDMHNPKSIALSIVTAVLIITGMLAGAGAEDTTIVVPINASFPISLENGIPEGKPGVAFDGNNFLVVYYRDADIYACRVTPQGVVLDTTPVSISVGLNDSAAAPSVEFDGTNYLVVWVAARSGVNEIYGALVTAAGDVLNTGGVNITTGGNPMVRMPSISFDGTNYLVVWRTNSNQIYATRVSTNGTNLDSATGFPVATTGTSYYPSAAYDGNNYLVVWHDSRNAASGWDIYGARITPEGVVLDPGGFVICNEPMNQEHSSVGFDGTNYLVVWYDWRPNNNKIYGSGYGTRVSPAGVVLDSPPFQIADRARGEYCNPKAICGGENCLVVWNTDYPNGGTKFRLTDVWGRRISSSGEILDKQAVPIATSFGHQWGAIAGYGNGRYLVAWHNYGREFSWNIYGQILEEQTVLQDVPNDKQINQVEANWTIESAPTSSYANAGLAFSATDFWIFEDTSAIHYLNGIWQSEAIFPPSTLYGSWASGPNDIWITGNCGGFSHYDGEEWTFKGCVGGTISNALWGIDSANLWAVQNIGKILVYDGTIHDAIMVDSGSLFDLSDIWGASVDNIYAVGERGTVLRFNGTTWNQQTDIPTIQRLNAIWGTGPNNIYAVGDWGTILYFNGTAWSIVPSGTLHHLYDVWGSPGSDVYIVGFGGTILHHNGAVWTMENSGTTMDLLSVWGVSEANITTVWASGSGQQILKNIVSRKAMPWIPLLLFSE